MSLLGLFFDLGTEFTHGMHETKANINSHRTGFEKLFSGEAVSVKEFQCLYDVRTYNINNRRSDIKFLKSQDGPGVYVLANSRKKRSYIGVGDKVFRKVYRHINGHGRADIFSGISAGDEYEIHVYLLSRSGHTTLNELEKEVMATFRADI